MKSGMSCGARIALGALAFAFAAGAGAQGYPVKPVRYIVAFGAGSGADTIGRIVAQGMSAVLGQQVIIDNRTGAAGNIAADVAAKSPPDGYTLLQASSSLAVNATLYKKLTYDLLRDFVPVTLIATSPSVVIVHPSLPARSVGELVKLAKARPGAINYASTGAGSATFMAAEMFKSQAGINLMHVPYRGGGEALTAVITGEVSVYFAPLSVALPHIEQGRVRALAVTTARRLSVMPGYATVAELGLPGYDVGNWYGVVVPVRTPGDAISALQSAVATAVKTPAISKRLADLGYIVIANRPEEFGAFIKSEIVKLGKVIRDTGVTAE